MVLCAACDEASRRTETTPTLAHATPHNRRNGPVHYSVNVNRYFTLEYCQKGAVVRAAVGHCSERREKCRSLHVASLQFARKRPLMRRRPEQYNDTTNEVTYTSADSAAGKLSGKVRLVVPLHLDPARVYLSPVAPQQLTHLLNEVREIKEKQSRH